MVDCRYKRNKKKKVCKDKKKKKGKKKITQKQSQKQTVNIHIHQKKTKRKTRQTKKKHPYIPRVNAGASHIPLIINNVPQKSHSDYLISRLREDISEQRNTLNEMKEFNKMKYGENIALRKNIAIMEQEQKDIVQDANRIIKEKEVEAEKRGEQKGYDKKEQEQKEKRSQAAKKGAETKRKKKEALKEKNIKSPRKKERENKDDWKN